MFNRKSANLIGSLTVYYSPIERKSCVRSLARYSIYLQPLYRARGTERSGTGLDVNEKVLNKLIIKIRSVSDAYETNGNANNSK